MEKDVQEAIEGIQRSILSFENELKKLQESGTKAARQDVLEQKIAELRKELADALKREDRSIPTPPTPPNPKPNIDPVPAGKGDDDDSLLFL